MNHDAVLAHPIWQVFGHLADPARLDDWLPAATAIHPGHGAAAFTLRLSRDPAQPAAAGELIGYEPPWQLAYRLLAGPDTHVLRITCTTAGAGTRVHIRQASPARPLAVDLTRLSQALTTPPPDTPEPARDDNPHNLAPATTGPSSHESKHRLTTHPRQPRGRPGPALITRHHPSINSRLEDDHARTHPIPAVPPVRRTRLLPGPARQRVDHRLPPPAASRPAAAGRHHPPARKDPPMNLPASLSGPAGRLARAAPLAAGLGRRIRPVAVLQETGRRNAAHGSIVYRYPIPADRGVEDLCL